MGLRQYRALILVVVAVLALLVASPMLQQLLVTPQIDHLTELSIFGQYHNATYPTEINSTESNRLYIDVSNHLGSAASYMLEMKFRNQPQSGPDSFNHTASDLPSLANIPFSLDDNASVELPLNFSIQYNLDANVTNQLDIQSITLNETSANVDSTTIAWDSHIQGFYGNLFFELWVSNGTANSYVYGQSYVSLWLKLNT